MMQEQTSQIWAATQSGSNHPTNSLFIGGYTMLANLHNHSNNSTVDISTLPAWQQAIISSINSLSYAAGLTHHNDRFSKRAVLALRPFIPYLIHGTSVPDQYILVNRDYRPIGLDWSSMVHYEAFTHLHLSKQDIAIIKPNYYHYQGWANHVDGNFFMDGSAPWISKKHAQALIKRLEKVISDLNGGARIV
jgi:hypothetical protein